MPMSSPISAAQTSAAEQVQAVRVSAFLKTVYGWMFVGLAITAVVAWAVAGSPALVQALRDNRLLFWAVLLAPIGFVWYLGARVATLSPGKAATLFAVYAGLNG